MLLALALYLAAYALCLGVLWIWRVNRRRERPPVAPKLLRGPGESLRWRLQRLDDALLLHAFGAAFLPMGVFVGGLMLALNLPANERDPAMLGAFALFILTLVFAGRWMLEKFTLRRDCHLGLLGEKIVAEAIAPLVTEGAQIFHDVPAGAFNLDHVVVSPTGVYAIETKTRRAGRPLPGRKPDEIGFDGSQLVYPWGEDTFGLDQAIHRAAWLSTWLRDAAGEPVAAVPVLTFPGWNVATTAAGAEVQVVAPSAIPGLVRNRPASLTPAQQEHISRQLETRCRDVEF
ncbi:MAG: NERD domain-containing protein [Verrucomicrobia bacterium]|nr:NERD domain-containing protein [Verrucomicrobiota bacterium]